MARVALTAVVWLVLLAGPAAADAARPGNVRSEVTGLTPGVAGVSARILGGDSFIELHVERGHSVVVLGYAGEPYLRIEPDGAVEVNDRSPARWLNARRYGGVLVPAGADASAPPDWRRIGDGGTTVWHDHRTHWMATTRPDPPEQRWSIPILVDGVPAAVEGQYHVVDAPAAWPWWLLAVGLAGLTLWLGWPAAPRAAPILVAAAVLVGVVGGAVARLPGGRNGLAMVGLAVVALVAGLVAVFLRRSPFAGAFLAGGGVALLVYAVRRLDVLTHAVLVTSLPAWLDRLSVAVSLGVGVAAVLVGLRHVLGADLDQLGGYQPPGTSASASLGPHDPRG